MKLTDRQEAFLQKLASGGAAEARRNNLPVSAMLACACQETSFGTHGVFLQTNNPLIYRNGRGSFIRLARGRYASGPMSRAGSTEVWRVPFFQHRP